jgi:cytosine/adenosine deaminase-related metal-dependent hydrolase
MELDEALSILYASVHPAPPDPATDGTCVLEAVAICDLDAPRSPGLDGEVGSPDTEILDIEIVNGVIASIETSVSDEPTGYVTPGLVDMHTHLPSDNPMRLAGLFGLLYLAHGVTTIRDTGDMDGTGVTAARQAFARTGAGPRIVSAGSFVGGPGQQDHRAPRRRRPCRRRAR